MILDGAPMERWGPLSPSPERVSGPFDRELLNVLRREPDGSGAELPLEDLRTGRAKVVVTGQQPCFPLPLGLTLMKIATTIAVAADLSNKSGTTHLPLFWSGGDDSDFQEARGQWIHRVGGTPLRVSVGQGLHRKGSFVGDLDPLPPWLELRTLLPEAEHLHRWDPRPGEDLGEHECRLLREIFKRWGLITLDARDTAVRRAAGDLYVRYAERRTRFATLLDEQGDRMAANRGERALRSGLGDRALFFVKRRRRTLPLPEVYREQLERKLEGDPTSLSPNASLRPLVQDWILPVAATVLGPGEWRYHRQLRPVFDLMEVPFPQAVPRLDIRLPEEEIAVMAPGGRDSSPLSAPLHPLSDPRVLIEAAGRHLENLGQGKHCQYSFKGA